jgi:hypothetical protein
MKKFKDSRVFVALKKIFRWTLNITPVVIKILNWIKPVLPQLIVRFPRTLGWLGPILKLLTRFNIF